MKKIEHWMEGAAVTAAPSGREEGMSNDYNSPERAQIRELESQVREQKNIIQSLYTIVVRSMVVLKNLLRIGALIGCWFYFGPSEAYWLAGFIVIVGLIQLTIDKTRKAVNPKSKLSEWNLIDD